MTPVEPGRTPATSLEPPPLRLGRAVSRLPAIPVPGPATDRTASPAILGRPEVLPVHWYNLKLHRAATGGPTADHDHGAASGPPPPDLAFRLAALLQPPALTTPPEAVLTWPAPLLPFQRDGVLALLSRPAVLLADDMGLGKTVQVAAALRLLARRGELSGGGALVVCPASLLYSWRREMARWAPELTVRLMAGGARRAWRAPAHVRLIGYEALRQDVLAHPRDAGQTFDVVVLDEGSRIKNVASQVSRACAGLAKRRAWILTGTPVENSAADLLPLLAFLGATGASGRGLAGDLALVQLRRRKVDVLAELPPKRIIDVPLELGRRQREAYDRAEREGALRLTEHGGTIAVASVLELIVRLKQLCNADPATGASAKLEDLRARLAQVSAAGHRALIFSQFVDETYGTARLARELAEFSPLVLTGAQTLAARAAVVDRFQERPEHRALILSTRAGGLGLNLQAASYVFHFDRWWNPATEDQAEARAHRFGQTLPVTVYRYVCLDTIEERIDALLTSKRRVFEDLVDGVSLDLSAALGRDELLGLLGLG